MLTSNLLTGRSKRSGCITMESFNHRTGQMPRIFPNRDASNLVIHTSGVGARSGFSVLMSSVIPDIQHHDNGQCFPLRVYEVAESSRDDLFSGPSAPNGYRVRDGITDTGLKHFQDSYPSETITKEDLFYYVYGLLHSEDYRLKYADNLLRLKLEVRHRQPEGHRMSLWKNTTST
jgi:predicted helicase